MKTNSLAHGTVQFVVSSTLLETVGKFKYFGRPITADGSDGMAVLRNISCATALRSYLTDFVLPWGGRQNIWIFFQGSVSMCAFV